MPSSLLPAVMSPACKANRTLRARQHCCWWVPPQKVLCVLRAYADIAHLLGRLSAIMFDGHLCNGGPMHQPTSFHTNCTPTHTSTFQLESNLPWLSSQGNDVQCLCVLLCCAVAPRYCHSWFHPICLQRTTSNSSTLSSVWNTYSGGLSCLQSS